MFGYIYLSYDYGLYVSVKDKYGLRLYSSDYTWNEGILV